MPIEVEGLGLGEWTGDEAQALPGVGIGQEGVAGKLPSGGSGSGARAFSSMASDDEAVDEAVDEAAVSLACLLACLLRLLMRLQ